MLQRRGVSIFRVIAVWSQHAYTFRVKGSTVHPVSLFSSSFPFFGTLIFSHGLRAFNSSHKSQNTMCYSKWQKTPGCMKCSPLVLFFLNKSSCFVDPGWSPLEDHFVLESIAHWVWAHFWPLQVFVSTRKKLSNNVVIFILVDLIIIHPRLVSQVSSHQNRWIIVAGTASVLNDSLNNVKGLRE